MTNTSLMLRDTVHFGLRLTTIYVNVVIKNGKMRGW